MDSEEDASFDHAFDVFLVENDRNSQLNASLDGDDTEIPEHTQSF
jgi:hypothetical protein